MTIPSPHTLAECYQKDPDAFRAVLADAERHGLDVLAEPMKEAVNGLIDEQER